MEGMVTAVLLLLFIAIIIVPLVMYGGGYLLSLIIPLSHLHATGLVAVSLIFFTFALFSIFLISSVREALLLRQLDDEYEIADNENIKPAKNKFDLASVKGIARNGSCPCGSGKKFKVCCLKKGARKPSTSTRMGVQ